MKVRDVMTIKVVTVSPDHSVRHAAKIMLDNHVSGIPVVDDAGRLALFAERGVQRRASRSA